MKKICKNCKFWVKNEDNNFGHCEGNVFVYTGVGNPEGTNISQVQYSDYESYSAYVETGADFGCNHWEKE